MNKVWRRRGPGEPPLVIGHRGASAHEVENTLAAFRRARADGADGVEFDVHLCGSGEPVVHHDEDLRRLEQRGERLAELSLPALREMAPAIPTLDETLEELGSLLVNIEIKAARLPPRRLVPAVVACVRRHAVGERALLSSFNPLVLAQLLIMAPDLPRALIFGAGQALPLREAWSRPALRPAALHPEHVLATLASVRAWHGAGYAVNVWTVDDPAALARVRDAGVDGVIANDPGAARARLT